jgi:hypothetical protein
MISTSQFRDCFRGFLRIFDAAKLPVNSIGELALDKAAAPH